MLAALGLFLMGNFVADDVMEPVGLALFALFDLANLVADVVFDVLLLLLYVVAVSFRAPGGLLLVDGLPPIGHRLPTGAKPGHS